MPRYECPNHPGKTISPGSGVLDRAGVLRTCERIYGTPTSRAAVRQRAKETKLYTAQGQGLLGAIGGAIGGLIRGGPIGAIEGGIRGLIGDGGGGRARPAVEPQPLQAINCPDGQVRVGKRCVDFGAALPGGDPFISTAGGVAVEGSFGLPAIQPDVEMREHRSCPTGMVLGRDNLCYPRQVLSRRSSFRKWKGSPRPPITAADAKALRKVDAIRGKLKRMGKKADLKVSKK